TAGTSRAASVLLLEHEDRAAATAEASNATFAGHAVKPAGDVDDTRLAAAVRAFVLAAEGIQIRLRAGRQVEREHVADVMRAAAQGRAVGGVVHGDETGIGPPAIGAIGLTAEIIEDRLCAGARVE